jgi:ElaB/YqjD/DUF883 family membrane-anchored ribosome-binding protein
MTSSEQLEREAEMTRAHIAATLDELRAHLSPGHVVDQLVDYANDSSGGMFFRNLRDQVASAPVPIALMGAGLGWFLLSNRNGTRPTPRAGAAWRREERFGLTRAGDTLSRSADDLAARAGNTAAELQDAAAHMRDRVGSGTTELGDRAQQLKERAKERARAGVSNLQDTASDTMASAKESLASAGDSAASAYGAAADSMSSAYDAAASQVQGAARSASNGASAAYGSARTAMASLQEHPFLLAGIGVAIGALIGAVLPSTEAEDRLVGDKSDALKEDAANFAESQMEKGAAVVERGWESVKEEAQQQGLPGFEPSKTGASAGEPGMAASQTDDAAKLVPDGGAMPEQQREQHHPS